MTRLQGRTAVKPAAEPPESCVPLPALGRPPQPAVVRRQTLGPAVSAPSFSVEVRLIFLRQMRHVVLWNTAAAHMAFLWLIIIPDMLYGHRNLVCLIY